LSDLDIIYTNQWF